MIKTTRVKLSETTRILIHEEFDDEGTCVGEYHDLEIDHGNGQVSTINYVGPEFFPEDLQSAVEELIR